MPEGLYSGGCYSLGSMELELRIDHLASLSKHVLRVEGVPENAAVALLGSGSFSPDQLQSLLPTSWESGAVSSRCPDLFGLNTPAGYVVFGAVEFDHDVIDLPQIRNHSCS